MEKISVYPYLRLVFLSTILWLFACKPQPQTNYQKLIIHQSTDAQDLNPVTCRDVFSNYLCMQLFQPLVGFDYQSEKLVGILAKSPPTKKMLGDSLLVFDYSIRPKAKWNDGNAITAKDVLFSLKAHLCPGVNSFSTQFFQFVKEFRLNPNDSLSFQLVCENLGNSTLYYSGSFSILPAQVYDPEGILTDISLSQILNNDSSKHQAFESFSNQFNVQHSKQLDKIKGSGPYQIDQWQSGERILLSKKKDWWGSLYENENSYFTINSPSLQYEIIEDKQTTLLSFKAGEIDFTTHLDANQYQELTNDNPDLKVLSAEKMGYQMLAFNLAKPILKQIEVRQALSLLIPREKILETVYQGAGQITNAPLSATDYQAIKSKVMAYSFNPDSALKILRNSDWEDQNDDGILEKEIKGEPLSLSLSYAYNADNESRKALGLILKQEAAKIGISIELEAYDWSTYRAKINNGEVDMFFHAVSTNLLPPDYSRSFHSQTNTGGKNIFNYKSESADSLIHAIKYSQDDEQRQNLIAQFSQVLRTDLPVVFLWTLEEQMIARPNIQNLYSSRQRPHYWVPAFKKVNP